ncbi:hypothetical protein ACOME3_003987 [Neoechinorhynchus agilis]
MITHQKTFTGKEDVRTYVYSLMGQKKIAQFPFPIVGRIPNFEHAHRCAELLRTIEEFENAKVIKIDPDSSLYHCRRISLEAGKTVLVPSAGLRNNFKLLTPPTNKCDITRMVTLKGIGKYGHDIELKDANLKVDCVITGCVAVDPRNGNRIGKGLGYGDLEHAILSECGILSTAIPIIAVCHSCQLVNFPSQLIRSHDVAVDIIVTEKNVIKTYFEVRNRTRIQWRLLTSTQINQITLLKDLKRDQSTEVPIS